MNLEMKARKKKRKEKRRKKEKGHILVVGHVQ